MTDIKSGPDRPPPWGYLATLGWTLLACVSVLFAYALATIALTGGLDQLEVLDEQPLSFLLAAVSCAVLVGVVALAARLRHWPAREYLGLVRPCRRDVVVALACLVVIGIADYVVINLSGAGLPESQLDEYRNAKLAGVLPLFLIDYLVTAPVSEEVIFRGFLQRGWVRPQSGAIPQILAISLISAIWTAAHSQYHWLHLSSIFLSGLLFGWVRWRSGSTLLTILMHAILNAGAVAATIVAVEWTS